MDAREIFQKRFSSLFRDADISQADFAKKIGVSRGLVSLWLHGGSFPRADALEKISLYFMVPVSSLISLGEESSESPYEDTLLALFRQLSPTGQRIAIERVQELVYIYGKKDQHISEQPSAASDNE